jgi:hypothetical protein
MAATLGGRATVTVDIPVCAVLIALYLVGAVIHMATFQLNLRRNYKFIPSLATFVYCMIRVNACIMRIAYATRQQNVDLAIVAQVFVAAGVVVLFILNLLFAQRLLRGMHPAVGWSRPVGIAFKALYAVFFATFVLVITFTVLSFFTTDPDDRNAYRKVQLYGGSFMTFITVMPLAIVAYIVAVPRRPDAEEPFGSGSWRTKILVVAGSAAILAFGAGFRLGTSAMPPRMINNPAWYHHKACFYVVNFGIELFVAYLWAAVRIDRLFYVPDGSSKVRTYKASTDPSGDTPGSVHGEQREKTTATDSNEDIATDSAHSEQPQQDAAVSAV